MQEKCMKNARKIQIASPTRENVSILHYVLGIKHEPVVFCSCFACVSVAFCSRFDHKPYQNGNPTHSVIWPLISTLCQKTGRFCLFLYEYFSIHIIIIS